MLHAVQPDARFAEWLDAKLLERGWSAADLVRAGVDAEHPRGFDPGLVSRWRKAPPWGVVPSRPTLRRLARALDVPVGEAFLAAGYAADQEAAGQRDEKVSYELLRRLERMQALLDAGYPKATLLAVLDANIQMAETIAVPASKTAGVPASNPSGGGLEPGVERDPLTLRCLERDLVAA